MRPLLLYYPKCDTCRRAVRWLAEQGVEAELRDIATSRPSEEELRRWVAMSALPVRKFFNTSGLRYKALGLKEKLGGMSDEEMIRLLATDGMLVKRPLLVVGACVRVGFRPGEWSEVLHAF
ncbi:arsenate reductase family protein [uncultured Rikenella sp.]|uniref:arsenate reductase family protein n=1 Tax=uncultured Rikenella sp. TaxID=368003 RepID=UPI0025EA2A78|nr:arsenate reductase family protein [uncultured Rikenella sp.]